MASENVVNFVRREPMDLVSALRLVFKGKEITRHDWQGTGVVIKMHNAILSIKGGLDATTLKPKPMYAPWNICQVDVDATDYIEYVPGEEEAVGPDE